MNSTLLKWLIALFGGLLATVKPTFPVLFVGILFILVDSFTAYRLSQRVKKTSGKASGKFQSAKFAKVITSIIELFVIVLLAHFAGTMIFVMFDNLFFANWAAGIYCFKELWSILENESSCNGSSWAKLFQKIMIDKTARHFDVDLSSLEDKEENKIE